MEISAAVLVGGQSRRMGMDKATLFVGGRPLIQWVISALEQVADEILLVGRAANRLEWLGLPMWEDLSPDGGPLAGIHTALTVARYPLCLVVACDMPFLQPDLLRYMAREAAGWDVVVPLVDGHLEPLHAVYARSCLAAIGEMLGHGETCPLDLYPRVRTRYIGPEEIAGFAGGRRSFININTPQELAQVTVAHSPLAQTAHSTVSP
ncbi:MAG: molybdenum cofactor guanylyltransferase [Anaerolineae bacterium]